MLRQGVVLYPRTVCSLRADAAVKRRLSPLSAVCGLVLAVQVTSAQALDAPQPPVLPTVPTIAIQVSVSVPGVSVGVQAGSVDVSVATATVDVSVSVSTEGTVPSPDAPASGEQQQATRSDGGSSAGVNHFAPTDASAKPSRPPPVAAAERLAPPPVRATNAADTRLIPSPQVSRSTRSPAARQVLGRTIKRRTTKPEVPRHCCENAQAPTAIAAAPTPPRVDSRRHRYELAGTAPATLADAVVRDNRLLLQLGVLIAFLYLVCLAGWFAATRLRRGGPERRTRR